MPLPHPCTAKVQSPPPYPLRWSSRSLAAPRPSAWSAPSRSPGSPAVQVPGRSERHRPRSLRGPLALAVRFVQGLHGTLFGGAEGTRTPDPLYA